MSVIGRLFSVGLGIFILLHKWWLLSTFSSWGLYVNLIISVIISHKSSNKESLDTTRFIKLHPEQHSITQQGHVISKTCWLQCVNSVDPMCVALRQCLRISLSMWHSNLFGDLFKLYSSEIAQGTFFKV